MHIFIAIVITSMITYSFVLLLFVICIVLSLCVWNILRLSLFTNLYILRLLFFIVHMVKQFASSLNQINIYTLKTYPLSSTRGNAGFKITVRYL